MDDFTVAPPPNPLPNGRALLGYIAAVFLGSALTFGGLALSNRIQPAPLIIQPPAPTATAEPTATPSPVRVYVNGQVNAPGVYTLPPHSIAQEAIRQAGGFTSQAYADVVNLALPLSDGLQIYVPNVDEAADLPPLITNPSTAATGNASGITAAGLVSLNSATAEELDTLPGIGPSTAAQIIAYRDQNGPFTTLEAIMDVPGIGPAKFEAIKELITLNP